MAKTLADLLVERLIDWGVDTVFGYPGDGINGIFEALRTHQDKLRFIQVRHEEAAALAACGHAKFTGRLGVCLATSGPGGIHLLNGLYDAKYDGQPVLAITGHTFHDLIGTQSQQDVDLEKLFMDVAAYSERVSGPQHIVNVLDQAVRVALTKRTVTHITIPKDMQAWSRSVDEPSPANIPHHSSDLLADGPLLPSGEQLRRAAEILNAGKKTTILVGRGCLDARQEITALAERLGAPIVKALLGKAVVPDDHPYTTGGIGLLGTSPSYEAMKGCDTLLLVGTNFPYLEFYPKPGQARCVQIDRDGARIGLRCPVDVGLVGDCRRVLQELLPNIEPKEDGSFLEQAQKAMKDWREILQERGTHPDKPMKPQAVAYQLDKVLADDAIVTTDCGTVTVWGARYITARERTMFSSSGILATMGNGLPYSIAAALAYPGRQVVCLVGDGGFSMLMAEMATLVKYKLPVKVVLFKNNSLGHIKWEQMALEGNPEFGCDLQPIDFAGIARSCGAAGYSVDDPAKLTEVLRDAFTYPGPALVEAVIDSNEPVMPGHISVAQALNFGKALVRGQRDGWAIFKNAVTATVREVV